MTRDEINPLEVAIAHPDRVGIVIGDTTYRQRQCPRCRQRFWVSTRLRGTRKAYCSADCKVTAQAALARKAQIRHKNRIIRKHGKRAYYLMYGQHDREKRKIARRRFNSKGKT